VAVWRERLNLADLWDAYPEEMSLAELCTKIIARAATLQQPILDYLLDPIRTLSGDADGWDETTFNAAWSRIYDWADRARLWIATF